MVVKPLLVLLACLVVGCRRGDDQGPPIHSGHYVGTWNANSLKENGDVVIDVAEGGDASGSITSSYYGTTGVAHGYIHPDGSAYLAGTWDSNGVSFSWQSQGVLHLTKPDEVTGDLNRVDGDSFAIVTWHLQRR